MSVIDRVKSHFETLKTITIEVEEWKDEHGNPSVFYSEPLTLEEKNITIMDSIEIIFDRKIGDEQMHFAIGEARAHLIHLDVTNQAKSKVDERGTVHYSKI